MTTLQYKSGGSWFDIPDAALYGTYGGTYHIEYPPAAEIGLDGAPCAATGKPRVIITTPWLDDSGMAFWRSHFATVYDASVAFAIQAWDSRAGATVKWIGKLKQPTWASVGVGSTAAQTVYRDVRIEIVECETTS